MKLIERLAKPKLFWKVYSTIGIVLLFLIMFFMVLMLFLSAYGATLPAAEPMPLENVLVLPGINPLIPIWFGLFALIIAVVIHEFAHGILARVADIKLKSMGVVLFIIPIGAFVEPDEDKLRTTGKLKRDRVFAAGPATNIFFGLFCAMLFAWSFMGSLEPVEEGVVVLSVTEDNPAELAGLEAGMVIVYVEGNTTNGTIMPGLDIDSKEEFNEFMDNTSPGDTINLTVYSDGRNIEFNNITLVDKGEYYKKYPELRREFEGMGFLGISSMGAGEFIESISHPVSSAEGDRDEARRNLITFAVLLPLDTGILPFHEPLTDLYEPQGALGALPAPLFWFLANLLYYCFWLNLLVGVFNALPAVPLDGGYPYRDAWDTILAKLGVFNKENREETVGRITVYTALMILLLLTWTITVPYLK
jgi:membrane-associated protease RseP (regulator of RpoE activity)